MSQRETENKLPLPCSICMGRVWHADWCLIAQRIAKEGSDAILDEGDEIRLCGLGVKWD